MRTFVMGDLHGAHRALLQCLERAGFNRAMEFKGQVPSVYYWNRGLWTEALSFEAYKLSGKEGARFRMVTPFNHIFIGHTGTMNWKTDQPMMAANIFNLDTGAGHVGRLTIMDVETKEFWQSDPVWELYGARITRA